MATNPQREAAKASLNAILASVLQDLKAARELAVSLTDWDSTEQEQCVAEDLYDYVRSSRLSVQAALLLTKSAPQQPAPTIAELHARFVHPAYEYATTQGPRKKWDQIDDPPEGDGWERNIDAGRPGEGWERFDYHEESYWRRLRPNATCDFPSCGHPDHQAASDLNGGNEQ